MRRLAPALAALPLLAAVVISFAQTGHALYPYGDHAIVQGETQRVFDGDQLLGTYSRYSWHHPGPLLFFWMAPFYELFGQSPAALNGAVALLNALAVMLLVAVTLRAAGRVAGFAAAALSLVLVLQLGAETVRDFWIPHSVIFPFAAFVVVAAAAACGRAALLPVVVVLASFLAQTDLSLAPATAVVLAAAAAFAAKTGTWQGRVDRRLMAVTALAAVIVWFAPFKQQLGPGRGNMRLLIDFFTERAGGQSPGASLDAVSNAVAALVLGPHGEVLATPAGTAAHVLLGVTVVLLAAGLRYGLRDGRHFAAALCALSLAAILAELIAVTRIRDELFTYLVDWFAATAVVAWLGIGCALVPLLRERLPSLARRRLALAAATAAALALAGVLDQARNARLGTGDPAYADPAMRTMDLAVRDWVARNQVKRLVIYIVHHDHWSHGAGIYIDQLSRGEHVAIDPEWLWAFGQTLRPRGDEDGAILVLSQSQPHPRLAPNSELLVTAGGSQIFGSLLRRR